MLWISLLIACTDDFKNVEQNISPLDTAEMDVDTGENTGDTAEPDTDSGQIDTEDTNDNTDTEEPMEDFDGDGWTEAEGDCDDDDANINPGVPDNSNDGIDQNCDGIPDDGWVDPQEQDQDGDGYSPADGDCLDTDPSFTPDAIDDECDGMDQNCDGVPDDGFSDPYEPNDSWTFGDTGAVNYLGRLDEGDGLIEIYNYHSSDSDVDTFAFYNEDAWWGWDFNFTITVWDVPSTLDLQMSMEGFDEQGTSYGVVATATSNGPGTALEFSYEGDLNDNTGYYVVTITGVGSDCNTPYQIKFEEH